MKNDKSKGISLRHGGPFTWKRSRIQWDSLYPLKIDSTILCDKYSYNYQLNQGANQSWNLSHNNYCSFN